MWDKAGSLMAAMTQEHIVKTKQKEHHVEGQEARGTRV
jgi:hypothetical protein